MLTSTTRRSLRALAAPALRSVSTSSIRPAAAAQAEKAVGDISAVFSSLAGDAFVPLEQRFSDLKKSLWNDGMIESWRSVLAALAERTEEIKEKGAATIPQLDYKDIAAGKVSAAMVDEVKRVGTVVVHGAVPEQEALKWKSDLIDYIKLNEEHARGFPAENTVVWELYNSKSQTRARTHPGILNTQRFLLSFFGTSDPTTPISVQPISYHDRLRIRPPGDVAMSLGPHIDGGSLERWEDPEYRRAWRAILAGGPEPHIRHDSWDLTPRLEANQDYYNGAGQCSVLRMFQGWTALSNTAPGEGTLQVFPDLDLATAYVILRPFFRERRGREGKLGFDDWEPAVDDTAFPGSVKGKGQEMNAQTHPHLRLNDTMVSVPRVFPGSQVHVVLSSYPFLSLAYWHCDGIHAVESQHHGSGDSSVLYIPAVPLTEANARYLRTQRDRFEASRPAPDFPGGPGESLFKGVGEEKDILTEEGRVALGYKPFEAGPNETEGGRRVIEAANRILFSK
ncbi:hypothetical protein JCM8547_005143 [Rhodosporidiobolus lusitaniae]